MSRNPARERKQKDNEKFPLFRAFGDEPAVLSKSESLVSTPDQRIASIWRFLARKANIFIKTLKANERSNFDVEDVLSELYATLRDKDHKWEPTRGQYITFASSIVTRELSAIRDRSRTVQSPRNSTCRMCEYQEEADEGTITDRRNKTFLDIKRSTGDLTPIAAQLGDEEMYTPFVTDNAVGEREDARVVKDAINWGLMSLTAFESFVMGEFAGLNGKTPRTLNEIAERTGKSRDAVKAAKDRAFEKVKVKLISMGHPAIASEN